jgi:HSP20 family protein
MATQIPVKRTPEARGEPMRPLEMFEEMERWAENMMPRSLLRPLHLERLFWSGAMPQVDIIDREAEIVVRAAVPGFTKDDIEVTTTGEAVTLRGCARREKEEERGEYYRHEVRRDDFLRTIYLPCAVDDARAKAVFKDGLLELTLPKAEAAKRHTLKIEQA